MSSNSAATLEIEDLQAAVLHPRPTPYAGTFILVRVDDRRRGRELVRRLIPFLPSAGVGPKRQSWAALALTFEGLRALGVPEGRHLPGRVSGRLAARAEILGDADESAAEHWEAPIAGGSRSHGNPRQNVQRRSTSIVDDVSASTRIKTSPVRGALARLEQKSDAPRH